MNGDIVAHVVRRGVEIVQDHYAQRQAYLQSLQHDAELYELSGDQVKPGELLPVALTFLVAMLVICSIEYTIGSVMVTLASIESCTSPAIVETKPPPPYSDAHDVPIEKEPLTFVESEENVELTVIEHKPITASIRTTIRHLHRVGGFSARWRGVGLGVFYGLDHYLFSKSIAHVLDLGIAGEILCDILFTLALCRVHMAWTHKMISHPSGRGWAQRAQAPEECWVLILPNLIYALARRATFVLPMGVAFALGVAGPYRIQPDDNTSYSCAHIASEMLSFLAVLLTYAAVALLVLLPASVTLTRIEAALLPQDEQTIVPFDKERVLGDADISTSRGCHAVFAQAWRSFDRASRWRLIKVYIKMVLAQLAVGFIAVHFVTAELYLIGVERLAVLVRSAMAQLKLMAIEAHEHSQ